MVRKRHRPVLKEGQQISLATMKSGVRVAGVDPKSMSFTEYAKVMQMEPKDMERMRYLAYCELEQEISKMYAEKTQKDI